MSTTISDPWLGDRDMPTSPAATLRDIYRMLCAQRDKVGGYVSKELLDDIDALKWIFERPNQASVAEEYLQACRPRVIAHRKGWIP